jgi:hypothetical protein
MADKSPRLSSGRALRGSVGSQGKKVRDGDKAQPAISELALHMIAMGARFEDRRRTA